MSAILVVDDDRWYRALLAQRLRDRGHHVEEADSGEAAMEALRHRSADLVLLDLAMPDLDGMEALRRIRTQWNAADLPVVMLTAHDDTEHVVGALEQGANDYVSKEQPFSILLARAATQLSLRDAFAHIRGLEQQLAERNQTLERANAELESANRRMRESLDSAARIQRTLLPNTAPERPGMRFAWRFRPCEELAGDTLNVLPLDDGCVALYVLDVVGHGVPAALLSVTVSRMLAPVERAASTLHAEDGRAAAPARVTAHLDGQFPWDGTGQFFTLLYGVIDRDGASLSFASAGHPGPVRVPREGEPEMIEVSGTPIGLGLDPEHEARALAVGPGDRFYFFSDGVVEAMSPSGEAFGARRVFDTLAEQRGAGLQASVDALIERVERFAGAEGPHDDVSVVALEREPDPAFPGGGAG